MTFASSGDGSITLHLANSGQLVDHIDYKLSRPGMSEITGTIPVIDDNQASMRIAGLPAAQGYALVLKTQTRDGIRCIGAASFEVLPNQQTPVLVELSCVGSAASPLSTGMFQAAVTVRTAGTTCTGAFVFASPFVCHLGEKVQVHSTDVLGATGPVAYRWTVDEQEVSTARKMELACMSEKEYKVRLRVFGSGCELEREIRVNSIREPKSGKCGDGVLDPETEACDDGNNIDNDSCSNDCRTPVCGDGIVQGDEVCDGGDECNDDCQGPSPLPLYLLFGIDCLTCMEGACHEQVQACDSWDCQALQMCHLENMCLDPVTGPLACLCGSGISIKACMNAPEFTGPCAEEIQEDLGTQGDMGQTLARFMDINTPMGRAHQSLVCMTQSCRQACPVFSR